MRTIEASDEHRNERATVLEEHQWLHHLQNKRTNSVSTSSDAVCNDAHYDSAEDALNGHQDARELRDVFRCMRIGMRYDRIAMLRRLNIQQHSNASMLSPVMY